MRQDEAKQKIIGLFEGWLRETSRSDDYSSCATFYLVVQRNYSALLGFRVSRGSEVKRRQVVMGWLMARDRSGVLMHSPPAQ